jgi:hypothetical protein
MSKTFKSRLTASRKKRRKAVRAETLTDCLDELGRCRARLSALAGLMVSCDEVMASDHIREIGTWIGVEVSRLDELTGRLEEAR